ncbi:MAG: acyltransferase [Bacteroidales bacterium]
MNPYQIFDIKQESDFLRIALQVFNFQRLHNPVFRQFLQALQRDNFIPSHPYSIPSLPVEFFKTHKVLCTDEEPALVFESSGTTGMETSRHRVYDPNLYTTSFTEGFRYFWGDPSEWTFLALLPSYLERQDSSLIYMMKGLMEQSPSPFNGFYLNEYTKVIEQAQQALHWGKGKVMLVGVSFALLDLAECCPTDLGGVVIVETGGMKGRRRELTREELHAYLREAFGVGQIASEYGMTELLSQAWSMGEGRFRTPPWMRIFLTEPEDPFALVAPGRTGLINIIDLANYWSCSFLATRDLGRMGPDGSFEVLGRHDIADLRGCNLMVG